jgi:hypothetical protein
LGLVLLEGQAKANRTFQAEFMHADAALLQGGPLAQRPDWTRETIRRFEQRFQVSAELPSRIFLWTLRTHR